MICGARPAGAAWHRFLTPSHLDRTEIRRVELIAGPTASGRIWPIRGPWPAACLRFRSMSS